MSEPQKKIIPKFKKKLQGFLSDESGRITKEDILKVGMVAMGIASMIPSVNADYCSHGNSPGASHSNAPGASHSNSPGATHSNSTGITGVSVGTFGSIQSAAVTQLVNGHVNYAAGGVGVIGSPGHSNGQTPTHSNGVTPTHSNGVTPTHSSGAAATHGNSCNLVHASHASHGSHCSGICNCWSDERLKTNIEKIHISPTQLAGLSGYTYDFVSTEYSDNSTNVGFLASEVESIFPHLITEKSGLKQVNYLGMIPILLESIKSLQMEVDLLKKISTQNA